MSKLVHSGPGLIALAVLVVLAWTVLFVVFWALTGWGVSIAVRTYRWCMRHHQPTPVVDRRTKTVTRPEGGLDRYQASQVSSR
jgi:hypothetical protein